MNHYKRYLFVYLFCFVVLTARKVKKNNIVFFVKKMTFISGNIESDLKCTHLFKVQFCFLNIYDGFDQAAGKIHNLQNSIMSNCNILEQSQGGDSGLPVSVSCCILSVFKGLGCFL